MIRSSCKPVRNAESVARDALNVDDSSRPKDAEKNVLMRVVS